jgi:hypothetical protein
LEGLVVRRTERTGKTVRIREEGDPLPAAIRGDAGVARERSLEIHNHWAAVRSRHVDGLAAEVAEWHFHTCSRVDGCEGVPQIVQHCRSPRRDHRRWNRPCGQEVR